MLKYSLISEERSRITWRVRIPGRPFLPSVEDYLSEIKNEIKDLPKIVYIYNPSRIVFYTYYYNDGKEESAYWCSRYKEEVFAAKPFKVIMECDHSRYIYRIYIKENRCSIKDYIKLFKEKFKPANV